MKKRKSIITILIILIAILFVGCKVDKSLYKEFNKEQLEKNEDNKKGGSDDVTEFPVEEDSQYFAQLQERNKHLVADNESLRNQVSKLKSEISYKNAEIIALKEEIKKLKNSSTQSSVYESKISPEAN